MTLTGFPHMCWAAAAVFIFRFLKKVSAFRAKTWLTLENVIGIDYNFLATSCRNLKEHERIHTSDKPFSRSHCDYVLEYIIHLQVLDINPFEET